MGIAPLMEHRLTFSQSSRDSIRHKGGEYNLLYGVYPSVVTDSPPETGASTPQGEGVDKLSAHSCRNEVYDHSSASVRHGREINLGALCALCVQNKNAIVYYLTQRTQRSQSYNANYAAAGVVAGYARQRTQR